MKKYNNYKPLPKDNSVLTDEEFDLYYEYQANLIRELNNE